MLTGSLASSMQGEPRSTHDIDVVVAIPVDSPAAVDHLIASFPEPDFYVDRLAMESAIAARAMFNVLDTREGDKIDFWLLTDEPFDQC